MTDVFTPLIKRAAAGTGKTFDLSSRFIGLLAAGEPADAVLATTFTRKAAGEIHDRVLSRLASAALGDANELALLREFAFATDLTAERARELLIDLLRQLHRLSICTLDSFFIKIAGSFTLELGLPPGWRVGEEVADQRLRSDAIAAMLDEDEPDALITLMRAMNPGEVRRAVHAQLVDVVGNLYSVYQRQSDREAWCWIDAPDALPDELLQQTIEALAEMEHVLPLTAKGAPVKRYVEGLAANVDAAQRRDWWAFLDKGPAKAIADDRDTYERKPIPAELIAAYRPLMIHARAKLLGELGQRTEATHTLLTRFDTQYRRLQRAARTVRFDTVTHALADAALTGDALGELYYRLDAQLHHLLLDEFQDTSGEQWRVLEPIASEIIAQQVEGRRSFFCVGDVKQAIYGWRGGEAAIFDSLETRWPDVAVERTSVTRRCSPTVVDAVNTVFGSLALNAALVDHADAVTDWARGFETHESAHADLPGYVRYETAPAADDGDDTPAQKDETLKHAARVVAELSDQKPSASIGVLVRTNKAVARMIYELRRDPHNVIASEEGGNPLTDSSAVGAVLGLIRMADHPGDLGARYLVSITPVGALVGLTSHRDDDAAERIGRDVRASLIGEGYGPTLWKWAQALAGGCDERDLSRLLQLVELGHAYDTDATLRPIDFVRYVENTKVADPTASRIRVMTVHQAKGLEFDAVVLPELDARLVRKGRSMVLAHYPDGDRTQPPDRIVRYANERHQKLEDDLREMADAEAAQQARGALSALYVAMTRPRYALVMVGAPSKTNESALPKTYAGIVRAALVGDGAIAERSVVYEAGDADWHAQLSEDTTGGGAVAAPLEISRVSLAGDAGRNRGLARRSPSSMEGGTRIDLADRMRLDAGGRDFGTAIHARLEAIEWLEDASLDTNGPHASSFTKMIERPAIRQLLSRDAYPTDAVLEVLREQPFAVRLDDVVLRGTFDRVVLTRSEGAVIAAELIDFKTDTVDSRDALAERIAHYRPQIDAYRRALARLYTLAPEAITAKLAFVSTGDVIGV